MDGTLNHSGQQFQNNGGTRGGARGARPPLNFIKKNFVDRPLPLSQGLDDFSIRVNERLIRVKNIYYRKSSIEHPRRLIHFKPI